MAQASTDNAAAANDEEKIEELTVAGDITNITTSMMTLETARTQNASEEMLLPLDKHVRIEGPKSLAQLQTGDRVSVQYRRTYRNDNDRGKVILKTLATKIMLLRSALPEGTLRSEDAVGHP